MSRRTWPVAARYVMPPLLAGGIVTAAAGRLAPGTARRAARGAGIGLLAGAVGLAAFFRDPDRAVGGDPRVAHAASDGVVTAVDDDVAEPWLPGGRGRRVAVFLSLADVHVTRSPVPGTVRRLAEHEGGLAPALLPRAEHNRRTRLLLEGPAGPVVVTQMAGALARRISSWVRPGEELEGGQRLGLIHFGSRTDVVVPPRATVLVSRGQRVRGGVTPLARLEAGERGA